MLVSAVKPHDDDARHACGWLGVILMALPAVRFLQLCGTLQSSF